MRPTLSADVSLAVLLGAVGLSWLRGGSRGESLGMTSHGDGRGQVQPASQRIPATLGIAIALAALNGVIGLVGIVRSQTSDEAGWAAYVGVWSVLWLFAAWRLWRLDPRGRYLAIGLALVGWLIQAIAFRYFEVISSQLAVALLLFLPTSARAFRDGAPASPATDG